MQDQTESTPAAPRPEPAATVLAERVLGALEEHVLGQRPVAEALLATYMAGGHGLLEGVPGVGKTLLARTFAALLGSGYKRIQFTPDLMPADVIGTNVYDQKTAGFRLVRGPIFTELLMADEINRTPPKTQAALLEAMQERQVTIDGEVQRLDPAFFVVATQNPIEHEGTYPLPEAQLDRFLTRIQMGLPDPESERRLYRLAVDGKLPGWGEGGLPEPVMSTEEAFALRHASRRVHVADDMLDYLARLTAAVRDSDHVELSVSPRGALALIEAARAAALLESRDFVIPDDLKRFVGPCWGHRLLLTAEAELEGHSTERLLRRVIDSVKTPK